MWTPRDWFLLSAAALATCSLTLAAFYPAPLIAAGPSPTASIDTPAFRSNAVSVTAAVDAGDAILQTRGPTSYLKAGPAPTLHVTAVNDTDAPATLPLHLAIDLRTARDRFSRVPLARPPVWQQDYALNLPPHEHRTFDVKPDIQLDAGSSLDLKASPTPDPKVAKPPVVFGIILASLVASPPPPAQPAVTVRPPSQPVITDVATRLAVRRAAERAATQPATN